VFSVSFTALFSFVVIGKIDYFGFNLSYKTTLMLFSDAILASLLVKIE